MHGPNTYVQWFQKYTPQAFDSFTISFAAVREEGAGAVSSIQFEREAGLTCEVLVGVDPGSVGVNIQRIGAGGANLSNATANLLVSSVGRWLRHEVHFETSGEAITVHYVAKDTSGNIEVDLLLPNATDATCGMGAFSRGLRLAFGPHYSGAAPDVVAVDDVEVTFDP